MFRPYKVGDFVEAAGIAGSVVQVQILTTVLKTGDNKQIIVPIVSSTRRVSLAEKFVMMLLIICPFGTMICLLSPV